MTEENSLVLEVFSLDAGLKMSLYEQREHASTLRHYSQCQVSFTEIAKLCFEVSLILNNPDRRGKLEPESVVGLKKNGQLLWDHLLTKPVKNKLKSSPIENLILSIDEELINVPWELLYDGSNFLCLNYNLGRLIRTKEQSAPMEYRSFEDKLKMLILANPTDDLKSAYFEGINIRNQFDRKRGNVRIDFKSTSIDRMYVKKYLCDYDIVHFAGHCEVDADEPRNTGWVLSDGRFTVQDILKLGETVSLPSLVFSNACYSAKTPPALPEEDYQERNHNLASAFLYSGVRHYIGAIRKIEDPISEKFARDFYNYLLSGKSVGECMRSSRIKLIKEHGIASAPWASYLLYGDPNFVLFKARIKSLPSKPKKRMIPKKKWAIVSGLAALILAIGIFMYLWLPSLNPNSYILFLQSRKLFKGGNNEQAIQLASSIIAKEPMFLAAYPLVADAYQRLGDKDNALKYYFEYALQSEKRGDLKNLAASYIKIGWLYHLHGDYDKALDFYNKALDLSRRLKDKLNEAVSLRKLAVWNMDKDRNSKALELLTKSSEINRDRRFMHEHLYNLGCDYFDLGLVFMNKNDSITAKEFYNKSRIIFEKLKLKNELSDYYFNLGEVYLFEKQYQKALDSYLKGLKADLAENNKFNLTSDYNMIGELHVEMDNLKAAEESFNKAVEISIQINALPELAAAYENLGLLYKGKGRRNKAREFLRQAQEIYHSIDKEKYQEIKNLLVN
ncbi:MAG: tetratricopeptide repeat protein [Candidatus Omnitrophica bacterium]|nr:tetratricopeptide repeat protein [Candidatus Omnitrophota bacterium]